MQNLILALPLVESMQLDLELVVLVKVAITDMGREKFTSVYGL